MFEPQIFAVDGVEISSLGPYRPWRHHKDMGGDGSNYPHHSGLILDVKQGKAHGVTHFYNYLQPKIKHSEAVAIVPSHDPEKGPGGLHQLAGRLSAACGICDGSSALVRHTKIAKLTGGGDRSVDVHLNSIHIPDASTIAGKAVLLIDDVTTSGHSLIACRELLLAAGARKVRCLALGRTTY